MRQNGMGSSLMKVCRVRFVGHATKWMAACALGVFATGAAVMGAQAAQTAQVSQAAPVAGAQSPGTKIVPPPPKPYVLPEYQRMVLPNGMTVLMLEKHEVPLVSATLLLRSGSVADPVGKEGTGALTAGLLRKGTATRSADAFSNDVDFIGMLYSAGVSLDSTSVSIDFLKKDQATALALLSDVVLHPTFPADEVTKLLARQQDAVRSSKDVPQAVLVQYFRAFLYGKQPYGRPSNGDETSLKAITRDDVLSFYKTNYTAGNAILAVSGDFDAGAMKSALQASFGGWSGAAPAAVPLTALPEQKGRRLLLVDKPDATQTYFAIGNVGIAAKNPDRGSIDLVNELFGGRFTSLLNTELRIKTGYTYGASSNFVEARVPGPFVIATFTKNATTVQAIDKTLEVMDIGHAQGFTEEQLTSAKNTIAGTLPPELETSQAVAGTLARNELYGITRDDFNRDLVKTQQTTVADEKRVLLKDFPTSADAVMVVVGKASEIGPGLKKYTPNVTTRKITDPGY